MDLAAIMDAILEQVLDGTDIKTGYAYPAESINPPCAVVGYPEEIEFDATFGSVNNRLKIPVHIAVGKVHDRSARDRISVLIAGVGSLKAALDGDLGGVVQTCRVTECEISTLTVAGVEYLSARLLLDIFN